MQRPFWSPAAGQFSPEVILRVDWSALGDQGAENGIIKSLISYWFYSMLIVSGLHCIGFCFLAFPMNDLDTFKTDWLFASHLTVSAGLVEQLVPLMVFYRFQYSYHVTC